MALEQWNVKMPDGDTAEYFYNQTPLLCWASQKVGNRLETRNPAPRGLTHIQVEALFDIPSMNAKSWAILSKVERAKKHIEDLQSSFEILWKPIPEFCRTEDNVETLERTFYLDRVPDIPFTTRNIIGDVLHNLRSALDHIAYALPLETPLAPSQERPWTQFPIVESAAKYMSAGFHGKVQLFRKDVVEALDAVKPYKGGNDALWRLHELNKLDKHRMLLTACITNTHRSMTPTERTQIIAGFIGSHPGSPVPDLSQHLLTIIPVPINAGDKLFTISHAEMEQKMKFHFDVAFNEPEVIECKPVIEALHEMAIVVAKTVLDFDDFLT